MESAANILDDNVHVRPDGVVLDACDGVIEPSTHGALGSLAAILLLTTIVSNSEGTLDRKYESNTNAKTLLRTEEKLLEKLNDAWTQKKFKEIRNLSAIYIFFNASS